MTSNRFAWATADRPGLAVPMRIAVGVALATGLAVLAAVAVQNAPLYPVVLSDEYRYSSQSRLLPLGSATVPSYLFLLVYRLTSACGDGFLLCGRLANLGFLAAMSAVLYRVARPIVGRVTAFAVALLCLASPFNLHTAYYMPEAMYGFGFWVVIGLVLAVDVRTSQAGFALVGVVLGLLTLVKPHALFLLPPLLAFVGFVRTRGATSLDVGRALVPLGTLTTATLATKLGVGWLIAGPSALTLFGSFYSGMATHGGDNLHDASRLASVASDAAWNFKGHALALALLFALPLAVLGDALVGMRSRARREALDLRDRFAVLAALVLAMLLAVAVVFTIAVAGQGPYETVARLHGRYLDFALPMLTIVGCAAFPSTATVVPRLVVAALVGVALVVAARGGLAPYAVNVIDYPELHGALGRSNVTSLIALVGLVSLVAWVVRPPTAAVLVLVGTALFVQKAGPVARAELATRETPTVYDRAGAFARTRLGPGDTAHLRVFGDDPAGVYQALFQIDDGRAQATLLAPGQAIDASNWPAADRWALVVGRHRIEGGDGAIAAGPGFSLVRRKPLAGN